MKQTDTVAALNRNTPLPKDRYTLQCIEEIFGPSKKGNLMITRTWQIIAPQFKEVNGQKLDVLGQEFKQYLTLKCFKKDQNGEDMVDEDKTKTMMSRVFDDYRMMGLPCDEIDENNPALGAKGLVIDWYCGAEEKFMLKDPTPEQIAKGQMYGDPVLDANGKNISTFSPKMIAPIGISNIAPIDIAA